MNHGKIPSPLSAMATIGSLLFLLSGCQSLPAFSHGFHKQRKTPEASVEHPVVECICLWEPGEGTGLDGLPCRGFAGQVLFFARGIQEPVKVDGDVTIYLFDDQGTPEEQGKPLQVFNFDSGSFQAFLTETNLGVAYQLFVPYTRSGNHRASCSIRTKLEPSGSSPVFSRMATVILPGLQSRQEPTQITQRRPTRSHEVGTNSSGIELASHETVASANSRFADTPSMETVVKPSLSELQQQDLKNRLAKAAEVAVDNNVVITNRRVSAAQLSRERRRHHPPEESDSHRIGAEPSVSSRHPLLDE